MSNRRAAQVQHRGGKEREERPALLESPASRIPDPSAPSSPRLHRRFAWALEQGLPLKDVPILAAAVQGRCDLLVTGDRAHFGPLYGRRLRGVEVLSPADALARLLRS
jgi:hypothetical protein